MARPKKKYRLQIVLERKEDLRDEAAKHLAECREKLRREQEEEARLSNALTSNRNRRREEADAMVRDGLAGGLDASGAQGRLNFIKRLDFQAKELEVKIEAQKKRVRKAEEEVEVALEALIQASRELQVMQKHKEGWQKRRKKEDELVEQTEMNEIGNVMYTSNRRNAAGSW